MALAIRLRSDEAAYGNMALAMARELEARGHGNGNGDQK